ncbi:miltefosine transporter beta subunit [Trypanosoma grayi]|uniref:miltefosine transporter beta subunit n=1 Tax=Trypanosoma grayi TaxID=71804 RepID=UPI0004F40833|nr:miltefosine transporter beta subunit [Trypanosoma grayi]KEG14761.1 miltefosine transporter beta subunit [Trypanosoma grayi]
MISDVKDPLEGKGRISSCLQKVFRSKYPKHGECPVFMTLALVAITFIPIGVVVIKASDAIFELKIRYDDTNNYHYVVGPAEVYPHQFTFNNSNYSTGARVRKVFSLSKSLAHPVFLQYRLVGFYQNHRRYSFSRDIGQMVSGGDSVATECEPFRYPGEFQGRSVEGQYFPCGAIAWSFFNDSFSLYQIPSTSATDSVEETLDGAKLICSGAAFDHLGNNLEEGNLCEKKGIALPSDVRLFQPPSNIESQRSLWKWGGDPEATDPYKRSGYYYEEAGHPIPTTADEDFLVWASLSYKPDFTKMYRIITTDLIPGEYVVDIVENFDVSSFSGEKYVVLVTRNWIGGKNYALGILFLAIGSISFVLAMSVVIVQYIFWRSSGL